LGLLRSSFPPSLWRCFNHFLKIDLFVFGHWPFSWAISFPSAINWTIVHKSTFGFKIFPISFKKITYSFQSLGLFWFRTKILYIILILWKGFPLCGNLFLVLEFNSFMLFISLKVFELRVAMKLQHKSFFIPSFDMLLS